MDHRELLRAWLRGKGYHPNDIQIALSFYDKHRAVNSNPTDEDVLKVADDAHREAVNSSKGFIQPLPVVPILKRPGKNREILIVAGISGGTATVVIIIYEVLKWLSTGFHW